MPSVFNPRLLKLLRSVYLFAKERSVELYLVGGYLRDIVLKRQKDNPDVDFSLASGAISFGKKLSQRLKAGFVVLDKEHRTCRLLRKVGMRVYTLDFASFRGATLKEDLLHRDFTINSLGLALEDIFADKKIIRSLIDYCGATRDLERGVIRTVTQDSFDEDPLRILRAFSLAAIFGFKIDRQTLNLIRHKRKKLQEVSPERMRDELFKILDRPDSFRHFLALDRLKILSLVIPEIKAMRGVWQGPYHHLDVWGHTLETLKQLDELMLEMRNNRDIRDYLNQEISSQRRRGALIRLGALLHDIGKPSARRRKQGKTIFHGHERIGWEIAQKVAWRLRLSNDEINSLQKIVLCHLRPGYLADNEQLTPRARFRFFRDAGQEGVSILLLSIADQRATRGRLTRKKSRLRHEQISFALIKEYFQKQKQSRPKRLLSGDELMAAFRLSSSPLIGRMLDEVEELQAIGKLRNKKEALAAARKLLPVYLVV